LAIEEGKSNWLCAVGVRKRQGKKKKKNLLSGKNTSRSRKERCIETIKKKHSRKLERKGGWLKRICGKPRKKEPGAE